MMEGHDLADGRPAARVNQSARLTTMLGLLDERPYWSVAELAARFDVSEETIRRDVRQLEQAGHVQKTHGGVSLPTSLIEAPYRVRVRDGAAAKQRIARAAMALIEPGMTILLGSGSPTFWLARALVAMKDLTIITNSVEIAHEALGRPGQRLHLAGGSVNPDYHAAFGPEPIAYCRRFAPDVTVLSMGAIEGARGFLDFDIDEATFKRSLLDPARRVMVLADGSKFDRNAPFQVAGYGDVDDLVTDTPPPETVTDAARAAGTRVHVAGE